MLYFEILRFIDNSDSNKKISNKSSIESKFK